MRKINLTGRAGSTYDLEEIKNDTENGRTGSGKLLVQVWEWNPNGLPKELIEAKYSKLSAEELEEHKSPNPANPIIGQIWLSKRV